MIRPTAIGSKGQHRGRAGLAAALAALFTAACGQAPVVIQRDVAQLKSPNGVSLNGVSLNGVSLNGVSLNGVSLNGVSLNGVSLNGVSLNGVSLNGANLTGTLSGVIKSGTQLVGATLAGSLSNGTVINLRIDAARQGTHSDSDVYFYRVSYQTSSGWSPICGLDSASQPIEGIPLKGQWNDGQGVTGGGSWSDDPTAMTFGCMGKALAKCVLLGYKPWKVSPTNANVALRPHHQACTRMLRADYCGNGTSHTVDGTLINLYDDEGINVDTATWTKEAEWNANGAPCVGPTSALRLQLTGLPVPACVSSRVSNGCGNFRSGTLMVTEYLQ